MVLGVPLRGIFSTNEWTKLGTVSTNPLGTDFLLESPVLLDKKKVNREILLAFCKAESTPHPKSIFL